MRILVINREPLGVLIDALKLCEYSVKRHDVTHLSFESIRSIPADQVRQEVPGVDIRTIGVNGSLPVRFLRWLSGCIREAGRGYDVVYVYYFPSCSLLRYSRWRTVMILDIRSGSVSRGWFARLIADGGMRIEGRCFQHLNVTSEGLRDKLGLGRSRTRILPVGGDPILSPRKRSNSLHLLYVGRMRRIEPTIEGFARFFQEYRNKLDLRYTIVGDQRMRLAEIIKRLGMGDAVELHAWVPYDRLPPFFERCNVGVSYVPITSYFDHQPPTKTFQYLLAGMPVIATATAEHRKLIRGCNGVLIGDTAEDFYRGLCCLMEKVDSYDPTEIRRSVAEYSWENIMLNIALPRLEEVASGEGASGPPERQSSSQPAPPPGSSSSRSPADGLLQPRAKK